MIEIVNEEKILFWANLASKVWDISDQNELIKDFKDGKFQNEFIYQYENEYIAFISLSIRNDYVEGTSSTPVAYIEGIYVNEEYRKKGIARELVDFAKKWAKEKGCTEIASDTSTSNNCSIAFHQAVGFEEKNRIVCFVMKID